MALILRSVLFFAFCTGSLAAFIPEGITLISSAGIPITHGGDERGVGIPGHLPQASTEETPEETPELPEADTDIISASSPSSTPQPSSKHTMEKELAGQLKGAVSSVFTDFLVQAVKVSDAGCGYCAGNETEAFHSAVTAKIDSMCSRSLQYPSFCQFFVDFKSLTVSALLKTLGLNPIRLGVLRCTASEGPCHPNNPSSIQMEDYLQDMHYMVYEIRTNSPLKEWMETPFSLASLALRTSMPPPLETEAGSCSACMKLGVDLYKVAIFQKMELQMHCYELERARPCEFSRKHPFLMDMEVTRGFRLWDRVFAECSLDYCPSGTPNLFAFPFLTKVDEPGDVDMVNLFPSRFEGPTSVSPYTPSSDYVFAPSFISRAVNELGLSSMAAESVSERRVARGLDAQVTGEEGAEVVLGEEVGRDGESVGKGGHDGHKGKKWEAEEDGGEGGHAKAHGGFWKHKHHGPHKHKHGKDIHMHMRMHGHGHREGREQEERGFGAKQHKHKLKFKLGHGRKHKQEGGGKEEEEEKEEEEGEPDAVPAAMAMVNVEDMKKKQDSGKAHKRSKLLMNSEKHRSLLCGEKHKRHHSAPQKKVEWEAGAGWRVEALKVVGSVKQVAGRVSGAVQKWGGQAQTAVAGALKGVM